MVSPAISKVVVFQVSPQPNLAEGFVGRHVCYRKKFFIVVLVRMASRANIRYHVCVCVLVLWKAVLFL
jgi:hypothetical protein